MSNIIQFRPETVTLKAPADLIDQGFYIPDKPTLIGSPQHRQMETYLIRVASEVPEMVEGIGRWGPLQPRPYQFRYAALAALRTMNVFGHEAGAGKTLAAILTMYGIFSRKRFLEKRMRKGMIHILSTPLSFEPTWVKELIRTGLGDFCDVITSEADLLKTQAPILIYSYDFLKRQTAKGLKMKKASKYRWYQDKEGRWKPTFVGHQMYKLIRKIAKPVMIVADEIHRLKDDTDRTLAFTELRKSARYMLGLTGTPLDGWVDQLGSILSVTYGNGNPWFPYTSGGFAKAFTHTALTTADYVTGQNEGKTRRIVAPGVPQHLLPKFYGQVGKLMHRLLFEDDEVSPYVKFPEADYKQVYVPLDAEHKRVYDLIYATVRTEIESAISLLRSGKASRVKTRSTILPLLTLLRQVVAHPWQLQEDFRSYQLANSNKLRKLVEIVSDFKEQGRKVVIFTNFIPTGRKIMEALTAAGIKSHRLYASDDQASPKVLSRKRRVVRLHEFMDDDSTALVGNLEIMAESITLSEVASGVIHFDFGWKSNLLEQGNKRVVRPGQIYDNVPVYYLITENTIESYVFRHIMNKLKANQRTVDRKFENNEAEEVRDTIEVLEQFLEANKEPQGEH